MTIDINYVMELVVQLLQIESPTGYTYHAIDFLEQEAEKLGYQTVQDEKGNLILAIKGKDKKRVLGFSAHMDTLGLMVRSIKENGTLAFTWLGAPILNTLDGEYCTVITQDHRCYSGTILSISSASHVFRDASTAKRDEETMEIRLDEIIKSRQDVIYLQYDQN